MSNDSRRTVNRAEAQLAYSAAATALDLKLDMDDLRELAEHTRDVQGITAAVRALREAVLAHRRTGGPEEPNPDAKDVMLEAVVATLRDYNRTLGGVH